MAECLSTTRRTHEQDRDDHQPAEDPSAIVEPMANTNPQYSQSTGEPRARMLRGLATRLLEKYDVTQPRNVTIVAAATVDVSIGMAEEAHH